MVASKFAQIAVEAKRKPVELAEELEKLIVQLVMVKRFNWFGTEILFFISIFR